MKNKYKKILQYSIILLAIAVIFVSGRSFSQFTNDIFSKTSIVSLTNESRKLNKVKTLKKSKKLTDAAQKKAEDMLKNQYFAHVSPNGRKAWDFLDEVKYDYFSAGENLAMNFSSPETVTEKWMQSPTHRANMLNSDYTEIGIGTVHGNFQGKQTTFIVQIFGRPLRPSLSAQINTGKVFE